MNIVNRFLISCGVLCISLGVRAHQPDLSSTLLVEQGKNEWVLQVRAALTAFEYEIHQHFGKQAYSSPEEFQELVIKHIVANTSVLFNKTHPVDLQNGNVKLGHETTVTFAITGTPESIQSLEVRNISFIDIPRNQSAFLVIKEGFSKDQFILNEQNAHTARLRVLKNKFELVTPYQKRSQNASWIPVGVVLLLPFLVLFLRRS